MATNSGLTTGFSVACRRLKEIVMTPVWMNRRGVLGMNRRNISYISRYNPRSLFPLVDNKSKTKRIALDANISTPNLIGVIENQHDVEYIAEMVAGYDSFVIKPAKGSQGKGILVVQDNRDGVYIKSSGAELDADDLIRHVSNILSGLYSLGGAQDVALVEDLIAFDPFFAGFSYEGVPDIRVIVFQGFPVMAMIRLATHASDGKANLHQGAVGVGLDIASGRAVRAVQFGQNVTLHPDTGRDLMELVIPHWTQVLELAASCYDVSGLGYLGADIVLDKNRGPMLLELNARPGLAIQVANGDGLLNRLKRIESLKNYKNPPKTAQRVALSQQWFGVSVCQGE